MDLPQPDGPLIAVCSPWVIDNRDGLHGDDWTGRHGEGAAHVHGVHDDLAHPMTSSLSVVAMGRRATMSIGYSAATRAVTVSRTAWIQSACGSKTKK